MGVHFYSYTKCVLPRVTHSTEQKVQNVLYQNVNISDRMRQNKRCRYVSYWKFYSIWICTMRWCTYVYGWATLSSAIHFNTQRESHICICNAFPVSKHYLLILTLHFRFWFLTNKYGWLEYIFWFYLYLSYSILDVRVQCLVYWMGREKRNLFLYSIWILFLLRSCYELRLQTALSIIVIVELVKL